MKFSKLGYITALFLSSLMIAGCESPVMKDMQKLGGFSNNEAAPLFSGYTCCNLRNESGGDWISELNYAHWPMIKLGTPATVTGYGRYRAYLDMSGKPMRLGQDYTRDAMTLEEYAKRIIVAEDPRIKLATYPRRIQDAILLGKVMKGMTKEQVIMSVGYPLTQENPDMNAPMWRMWTDSLSEYQLMWSKSGRVKAITADPVTKNLIVYKP